MSHVHSLMLLTLLNKRFLKKPLLIFLLCLIPVFAYLAASLPKGNALLIVGVSSADREDETARAIIRRLKKNRGSVVRYRSFNSEEALREAVYTGQIRLGFLFPEKLEELLEVYGKVQESSGGSLSILGQMFSKGSTNAKIRIICGSRDIVTKMEKEQFFSKIYQDFSLAVLKSWMDLHAAAFRMNKEERDEYLEKQLSSYQINESFFDLAYENGEIIPAEENSDYFASPIRGILSITLILICFSAVLFLFEDNRNGKFVWMGQTAKPLFHYAYLLLPVLDAGLLAMISLAVTPGFSGWRRELLPFLLYLLAVVGFSNLLRVLLRKTSLFSAAIPLVILACLFLTPVFFDLQLSPLQALLPPYFYLGAIHDLRSLISLGVYALVSSLLSTVLDAL